MERIMGLGEFNVPIVITSKLHTAVIVVVFWSVVRTFFRQRAGGFAGLWVKIKRQRCERIFRTMPCNFFIGRAGADWFQKSVARPKDSRYGREEVTDRPRGIAHRLVPSRSFTPLAQRKGGRVAMLEELCSGFEWLLQHVSNTPGQGNVLHEKETRREYNHVNSEIHHRLIDTATGAV
jgi:hypothetical protein